MLGNDVVDLSKPIYKPIECVACDHFGRNPPNIATLARPMEFNQWMLVCEMCRKGLRWSKKAVRHLEVILQ